MTPIRETEIMKRWSEKIKAIENKILDREYEEDRNKLIMENGYL